MPCPDENLFAQRIQGVLSEAACRVLDRHVADCAACRDLLKDLGQLYVETDIETDIETGSETRVELGLHLRRLGRYEVGPVIACGGMGVVYQGRDLELGRTVALKVLHLTPSTDERGRDLLRREAQAMARLNHPNVVTILDVGVRERLAFLAMERVNGQTVRAWQETCSPSAQEIVRVYGQAARGLGAAHRSGLVHRDVKPSNILIRDDDGRVQVADFGLALSELRSESIDELGHRTVESTKLDGTPRYMSPEQLRREPLDGRSDQYSLCVGLYEALYGIHPSQSQRPPRRADVERRWRVAVLRGLSSDPRLRHPSIDAMADALERPAHAPKRRIAGILAVGFGMAIAWPPRTPEVTGCAEGGSAELWNALRKARLREAYASTDLPFAQDAVDRVSRDMGSWSDRWDAGHRQACDRDASAQVLHCLDRQRERVDTLIEALTSTDAVEASASAFADLPDPSACLGPDSVAVSEQHRDLERALDGVEAELKAGRHAVALERLDAVWSDVAVAEDRPLWARANLLRADLALRTSAPKDAVEACAEASLAATILGDDVMLARVSIRALRAHTDLTDFDAALHAANEGRAALERAGGDRRLRADLFRNEAFVHGKRGNIDEALRLLDEGQRGLEEAGELDDASLALFLQMRGTTYVHAGRLDDGEAELRAALALQRDELGASHPTTAASAHALAVTLYQQGALGDALKLAEEAGAAYRQAAGERDPRLVGIEHFVGAIHWARGDLDGARRSMERALALAERTVGPEAPEYASVLGSLGTILIDLGETKRARTLIERSLVIQEAITGPKSLGVMKDLWKLGDLARRENEWARAEELLRRALSITGPDRIADRVGVRSALAAVLRDQGKLEEALEASTASFNEGRAALPGAPVTSDAQAGLAASLVALGRESEAIEHLEAVIDARRTYGADPRFIDEAELELAELLRKTDSDRERARAHRFSPRELDEG